MFKEATIIHSAAQFQKLTISPPEHYLKDKNFEFLWFYFCQIFLFIGDSLDLVTNIY